MADEKNPYVRETAVSAWVRQVIESVNALKLEPGIAASTVAAAQSAQSAEANTIAARDLVAGYAGEASTSASTATDAATTATGAATTSIGAAATAEAARDAALAALIIGAGRPDIPGTLTTAVAARVAAATAGAEFRSTDGPQGAWVWMKRAGGWVCVDGTTGYRRIQSELVNGHQSGSLFLIRTPRDVRLEGHLITEFATADVAYTLPAGFRFQYGSYTSLGGALALVLLTGSRTIQTAKRIGRIDLMLSWATEDPWPTTLPGVAA